MKKQLATLVILLNAMLVYGAPAAVNFAGNWTFDPAQSSNVGMMAQGKIQTVITQTKTEVVSTILRSSMGRRTRSILSTT